MTRGELWWVDLGVPYGRDIRLSFL